MAATVLTNSHYNGVRGLIAPDVTAEHISDDYLSQDPFAPESERKVRKRLKGAGIDVDTLVDDNLRDARLAMMHQCAALLCLTAPQQIRQSGLQVIVEVQNIDWQEKRKFHLSEADELVNDIVENVSEAGSASTKRTRGNPFGAVGTARAEVGEPAYPQSRRVYTDR